ncbi:TPA: hypothetical protein ACV194_004849, partial [Escherichia coli]
MKQYDAFLVKRSSHSRDCLFFLHRRWLYEYRNANERNISVKMVEQRCDAIAVIREWVYIRIFITVSASLTAGEYHSGSIQEKYHRMNA